MRVVADEWLAVMSGKITPKVKTTARLLPGCALLVSRGALQDRLCFLVASTPQTGCAISLSQRFEQNLSHPVEIFQLNLILALRRITTS